MDVFAHFLGLINRIPIWPFTLAVCGEGGGSHFILTRISFRFCYVKLTSTVFGFFAFRFVLIARLFLICNSGYSRSFCSHSLMLTKWGCDSICVGCKTGMIVELGICVFRVAIIEDYTSPSSYLKMTQHIITARLTHVTLSG